jgi:hypothetical protein
MFFVVDRHQMTIMTSSQQSAWKIRPVNTTEHILGQQASFYPTHSESRAP